MKSTEMMAFNACTPDWINRSERRKPVISVMQSVSFKNPTVLLRMLLDKKVLTLKMVSDNLRQSRMYRNLRDRRL
jgi:hypothetical protein